MHDKIVLDIDGTLCPLKSEDQNYLDLQPIAEVVEKLNIYREKGYKICLYTSRHMRTCAGNVEEIIARFSDDLVQWLNKHEIPFDELVFGKPWPGPKGFYVDDRAIRPDEFVNLSIEEINKLVKS